MVIGCRAASRWPSAGPWVFRTAVAVASCSAMTLTTGAAGELWVRTGEPGRFLSMRGYHNRPDDNARVPRNGWVATRDMCRFDDAGYCTSSTVRRI